MDKKEEKINHVEEYFSKNETNKGSELFRIDDTNSDIKSELTEEEIRHVNTLMLNDDFLERRNLKPVFVNYYRRFLRLKVSLDRKGRGEYVQINRADNSDETIAKIGNLSSFIGAHK